MFIPSWAITQFYCYLFRCPSCSHGSSFKSALNSFKSDRSHHWVVLLAFPSFPASQEPISPVLILVPTSSQLLLLETGFSVCSFNWVVTAHRARIHVFTLTTTYIPGHIYVSFCVYIFKVMVAWLSLHTAVEETSKSIAARKSKASHYGRKQSEMRAGGTWPCAGLQPGSWRDPYGFMLSCVCVFNKRLFFKKTELSKI